MQNRLLQQIAFIKEIDQLKLTLRQTLICGGERRENSAEHSWHLALLATLLTEHANESVNINRVIQMVLIHDIVEIDAGDTFIYDTTGQKDQAEREQKAADRLFGLLPEDQGRLFMSTWKEFEAAETADAKFAKSIDRMMPLIHNFMASGGSWQAHKVTRRMVNTLTPQIYRGSQALGEFSDQLLDEAVEKGYLIDD
ncbi:MAG: HD domain-containing protein [Chloroflexota bacterium]